MIIYFISLLLLNYVLLNFNNTIAYKLNIFDSPDKLRKFHKEKTPVTGGIIIFINIFFFYLFNHFSFFDNMNLFNDKLELNIFIFSCFSIFLLGFVDDKMNISANKKFLFLLIILIPTIAFQDFLLIENIKLSFSEKQFNIGGIGFLWSLLCLLLFINALNMFDGINLQVGIYSLIISIFFVFKNYYLVLFITLIVSVIFFLILNSKNKSFLGDGGSYLLAYIFGYFFIKLYNESDLLNADKIVLFMIIPGLDLMRLFTVRIIAGKNPFSSDRNHLHHILIKKNSLVMSNLISVILSIFSIVLFIFFELKFFLVLFIFTIVYFSIIFIFKKNEL